MKHILSLYAVNTVWQKRSDIDVEVRHGYSFIILEFI